MKVEVRPIPVKKWHGKTEKESFTRPKVVEALYDENIGGYATGLTPEEETHYGRLLGTSLDNKFIHDEPHPTWSEKRFSMVLSNNTMIFDTKDARQYVLVKLLKASKYVANSMKEYDNGAWPYATHVIFDEEEEVEERALKIERKEEVYKKISEMNDAERISLVWILSDGKKSLRGKSPSFIKVELDEFISESPNDVWKEINTSKAERFSRSTILEAISRQIIVKDGSNLVWMGDVIANSVEDAAEWLRNPENQSIKGKILEQLNS